jgi:putative endonuclease
MTSQTQPEVQSNTEPAKEWSVYIILASDDSLYTGITTDPSRRFREHASDKKGAKYFHGRKPVEIVYCESGHDRSSASKREAAIKLLDRSSKQRLIAKFNAD